MVPCISHISFAMIKYYKQKQLVEESIQYTDHHKRKFGQELKTGSQRRELKKPQRNADYCLVSYGLFSLFFFFFFIQLGTICRDGISTVARSQINHYIIIPKICHTLAYRKSDRCIFSTGGLDFQHPYQVT